MRMPPELDTDGTVSALAVAPQLLHLLDPSTPVPVIDVTTQSESASMPLGAGGAAARACCARCGF
jgi:hypothetical protein